MADRSAIEWTDATWNPVRARNKATGKLGWHCEHATTGCEFCYAEGFNKRLGTGLAFKPGHRKDVEIFLDETMLIQPLRWKKPRKIFPGSMTDLFADFVTDEMLDKIFSVMALTPQHTYQVVTKRAERMQAYFDRYRGSDDHNCADMIADAAAALLRKPGARGADRYSGQSPGWPLPNVWLGVSAERQQEADERIPLLLDTPAAKRFISAEPLLGPIDLHALPFPKSCECQDHSPRLNALDASVHCAGCCEGPERIDIGKLDWVIAGGESGPHARPMHPDWARGLRDQCAEAGVAFFFKQWGEWAPSTPEQASGNPRSGWRTLKAHPHVARAAELYPEAGAAFIERFGKAKAGRHLDGALHSEFPLVQP